MDIHKAQHILSILMESPLYLSLPLEERHSLLERLAKSYPAAFKTIGDDNTEESPVGYSRAG
jgi:hypothetical protein